MVQKDRTGKRIDGREGRRVGRRNKNWKVPVGSTGSSLQKLQGCNEIIKQERERHIDQLKKK